MEDGTYLVLGKRWLRPRLSCQLAQSSLGGDKTKTTALYQGVFGCIVKMTYSTWMNLANMSEISCVLIMREGDILGWIHDSDEQMLSVMC